MHIIVFDKDNKQQDYSYIAKDIETGKFHIGYVLIEQLWYSPPSSWTYYIVKNEYGEGGFCGGATDLGFKKYKVDKNTIEPYTQISEIKRIKEEGFDIELVEKPYFSESDKNIIAIIKHDEEIPYELWKKENL